MLQMRSTILAADIKGSTALIEKMDPEASKNLLGPLVKTMVEVVKQYDGTVIHTVDGILAVFGAPNKMKDHALRACLAMYYTLSR